MKNRKKRKVFYHKLKQNSSVIRWTIKFMMAFLFLALIWQFHLEAEGVRAEEEGITNPSVTQILPETPQMVALNTNPSFTAPSLNDFLLQPQQDLFRNTPVFSNPQSIYPVNGNPVPVNTKNPDIIYVSPDYEIEGDIHRHHIFVQGIKIATIETNSRTKQEKVYYHHNDHLGGSNLTTDQFGSITEETTYHPFGETRSQSFSQTSNYQNDYLYTGKEKDKGTDLYYYGARYYDPSIGRFTSIDPWEGDLRNPQTLNKYSYVMNNPVRYVDPTGEKVSEYQPYESEGDLYGHGEKLGKYRDVLVYSGGEYTGTKKNEYQCVDLAKRFAKSEYGLNLNYTGHAMAYGDQASISSSLKTNNPDNLGTYTVYQNGGSVMPQENDIISWSAADGIGHVAFIAEVVFEADKGQGWVYTLDQNVDDDRALYAQPLTRTFDANNQAVYSVGDRMSNYHVQGWARYQNQSNLDSSPSYTSTPHSPATQNKQPQPEESE